MGLCRNGLENVKHIIEQHANQKPADAELENLAFEKKQYELLLSQYVSNLFKFLQYYLNDEHDFRRLVMTMN